MFLSGLEVIIRSLHHWSTYLWIIKAGDPSGWNTVRVTDSAHRATAQQGWALSPVCRAQWERKWLQETCQIQVTLITPLVGSRLLLGHSSSRTNQINSSLLLCENVFQMWVNDEVYGGVRFLRSGRGLVWVSVAMSEPWSSLLLFWMAYCH